MDESPDVVMMRNADGSWDLRARDLSRLRDALGAELLLAFCRCFVHENRLLTFAHYRSLLRQHALSRHASLQRSITSMLWLEVGTIRELGSAIDDLRTVLQRRQWLDAPGFETLNEIERRWRRKLSGHRNKAAFHVDRDVLARGLSRISDGPALLMIGDGSAHDEGWMAVGDIVLMQGIHQSQADADELTRTVVRDREAVLVALVQVFTNVTKRAGLTYRQEGVWDSA
jgi:hypothetical protein